MDTNFNSVSFSLRGGLLVDEMGDMARSWPCAGTDAVRVWPRAETEDTFFVDLEPEIIVTDMSRGDEDDSVDFIGHVLAGEVYERVARDVIREFLQRNSLYELNARISGNPKVNEEVREQARRACELYSNYAFFNLNDEGCLSGLDEVMQEQGVYEEDRAEVLIFIRQYYHEEIERFYPDWQSRAMDREILREGSARYEVSKERDQEFSSGDDMVHIGVDLMPEESFKYEQREFRVPYFRDGDEPVTITVPKLVDGEWQQVPQKALAVYLSREVDGREITVRWDQVHNKYSALSQTLAQLASAGNWPRYNRVAADNSLQSKGALKACTARQKELRGLVYTAVREVSDDYAVWEPMTRRPKVGEPKGTYYRRRMMFNGEWITVIVLTQSNMV